MYDICKSLEKSIYSQVFSKKGYFSCIYPMGYIKKAGDISRLFSQVFELIETLTFHGSKEQSMKET